MYSDEYQQKGAGRYFGKYRGLVTDTADPKLLGRIMTRVPLILGDDNLGWCWPAPPTGGGENTGDFSCPQIGDFVWIEFEEGDPGRPIWSPGPWGIRDGRSMMPMHSRGSMDVTDMLMRDYGIAPPSQYFGSYGNVRTVQGKGASFLEFDDVDGLERVQLAHKTGTRVEMSSDGGIQEIVAGGKIQRISGVKRVEVEGGEERSVGGISSVTYGKKRTEAYADRNQTSGHVSRVGKDLTESWTDMNLSSSGGYYLSANAQGSMQFGGGMSMMVGQGMTFTVLENLEIGASNATGLPTGQAIKMHGYNGQVKLMSTDLTGNIEEANMVLDGTPLIGGVTLAGGRLGGQIQITNLPLANIMLGGPAAANPVILGTPLITVLTQILTELATHVHPTAMGPTSPSITGPILLAALTPVLPTLLSQFVMTA